MNATATRSFELPVSPDEAYADFCLWPVDPVQAPANDAVQAVSLLFAGADAAGCLPRYQELVRALRAGVGPYRTVWGLKWTGQALGCELYFYDYERLERRLPFQRIAAILAPHIAIPDVVDERLPYFMASAEIPMRPDMFPFDADGVDIYVGNPGSSVSSGICYRAGRSGCELKNFYFFFDRRRDWDEIVRKAACSAQVPLPGFPIETILPAWLTDCRIIVVANKRQCDAVYFSGITVDQLIRFMTELSYPAPLIAYVREARARLAHLRFDVGFDYRMADGRISIVKSGVYNVC